LPHGHILICRSPDSAEARTWRISDAPAVIARPSLKFSAGSFL